MVDHHQIGFAWVGNLLAFGGDALFAEKAKVHKGFKNAAAPGTLGVEYPRVLPRGLQQARLGRADADTLELAAEHAQIIQGVASR